MLVNTHASFSTIAELLPCNSMSEHGLTSPMSGAVRERCALATALYKHLLRTFGETL